jgi:hypothetical protein
VINCLDDQRTAAPKISSFVNPTDIAVLERLSSEQRLELLRAEIEKGVASGVSDRTMDEVLAAARAKARAGNG